ncbi:MAG TPA: dephospho-CoA kinase [Porphyromonadaceae bacterium]|nr:dephospho-CoA kinase [Porphyromonadaceae bacterium]
MESVHSNTLTLGQIHILEMLNRCKSEESLRALKKALCSFYASEVGKEMKRLEENGTITEQKVKGWEKEHLRTPYIHAQ